jgi:hypothetical protein
VPINPTDTEPRRILDKIIYGLRNALGWTNEQIYKAIQADYIEGQHPRVVQVVPGSVRIETDQIGGSLHRRMRIDLVLWYRVKLDPYKRSDRILDEAAEGVMDVMQQLWELLDMTTLDGVILGPPEYEGESDTSWHDVDSGVARRSLSISVSWATPRSTTLTMTDFTSSSSSSSSSS